LFRTTDGRTWERLPDTPSPGAVPVLLFRRDAGLLAEAGLAQTRDRGRTWSAPGLAPGIAGNYQALAVAASGTLFALDADQRTMVSSDDQGRTWTHRSTDLPGRGYTAIHGMTFTDAASGWLLTASLTGCGPACDPEGAVLATRSAGRSWTPVVPGR
jgi:photosystem II stability/assembly factor-like uncharacterized protein